MKIEKVFALTNDDTFDDREDAMAMDRADYHLLGKSKPVVRQPYMKKWYGEQDKTLQLFAKTSMLPSVRNRSESPTSRFIIDVRGMQNIQKPCTSVDHLDESSSERGGYTMVTPIIFKKTSTGELKPV